MNIRYMRVRYNVNNCIIMTALGLDFYLVIKENRCKRVRYNETPLYIYTYVHTYMCMYNMRFNFHGVKLPKILDFSDFCISIFTDGHVLPLHKSPI